MQNKKIIVTIATIASFSVALLPAFAQTTVNVGVTASGTARVRGLHGGGGSKLSVAAIQQRSDTEITARIDSLNKLQTRIQGMKNLSASDISAISTNIQTLVTNLTNLKASIDADTSTSDLKTDFQSITGDYRVYALVLPQTSLIAAADRVETIVGIMQGLALKFQARISANSALNVSTVTSALSDMNAKIADASSQAQAIVSEVSSLTPDQGDKTKAASNTAALKDARSKLQVAKSDLVAARADVSTIVKFIESTKVSASAGVTASTSSAS